MLADADPESPDWHILASTLSPKCPLRLSSASTVGVLSPLPRHYAQSVIRSHMARLALSQLHQLNQRTKHIVSSLPSIYPFALPTVTDEEYNEGMSESSVVRGLRGWFKGIFQFRLPHIDSEYFSAILTHSSDVKFCLNGLSLFSHPAHAVASGPFSAQRSFWWLVTHLFSILIRSSKTLRRTIDYEAT